MGNKLIRNWRKKIKRKKCVYYFYVWLKKKEEEKSFYVVFGRIGERKRRKKSFEEIGYGGLID